MKRQVRSDKKPRLELKVINEKYQSAFPNDKYSKPNKTIYIKPLCERVLAYREYKSDPKICAACPSRHRCTQSKNAQKLVTRHVWADYMDLAEGVRLSPEGKEIYQKRKETIERVFADAKEKHFMRYTYYRGLAKLRMQALLTFACMNLKKLAKWKKKNGLLPDPTPIFFAFCPKYSQLFRFA